MKKIFINGKVMTMDKNKSLCDAFIVDKNKFLEVGDSKEVLRHKNSEDEIIDLEGKLVVPGFNDSHIHMLNYGYALTKVDCTFLKSIENIIKKGISYIEENNIEKGKWVLGRGWNQTHFKEKRDLNKLDLDKISKDHPIVFTRICEHVVVANSKAIELAGITKETKNPVGGEIERDREGNLTGVFKENARYLIYSKIPDATLEDIKEMLFRASKIALSYGLTSVQSDDFETFSSKNWRRVLKAYKELIEENRLKLRIYEQCLLPDKNRLREFLSEGNKTGVGDEHFKIGPLKLLTDGSLGMRTAYLEENYSDAENTRGIAVFTQEELDELSEIAYKGGMNLVYHAIGDGAMNMCMRSFEKVKKENPKKDTRMGIVHLQITTEEIIKKFKELNIVAYAEPICINTDLYTAESRVGEERVKTSYVYKRFFEEGIHVALSSDCPVDSLNPMDSIYVAVTRKDYNGYPESGWKTENALSVEDALYGFTMGSAYASFEENIKGSIEKGKLADFVVLEKDIRKIDPNDIKKVKVEMTYLDGELVYKA